MLNRNLFCKKNIAWMGIVSLQPHLDVASFTLEPFQPTNFLFFYL